MIRVVHPGSRIRTWLFTHPRSWIQDPGVKKAPDPRCRIRIRNTALAQGCLYRPARLHWLAGRCDNPKPESTISPSPGLRIWPLFSACRHRWRVPSTMKRVPASASSSIRKTSPGKRLGTVVFPTGRKLGCLTQKSLPNFSFTYVCLQINYRMYSWQNCSELLW